MNKGDLVLIPFPFTNLTGLKNRPALVLYAGLNDVTVCFITSNVNRKEDYDVSIYPTPSNGLKQISLIKVSKIATLEKSLVLGKLGNLSADELSLIDNMLKSLFQLG